MLRVENLNEIYPNGTRALKDVSFTVKTVSSLSSSA